MYIYVYIPIIKKILSFGVKASRQAYHFDRFVRPLRNPTFTNLGHTCPNINAVIPRLARRANT